MKALLTVKMKDRNIHLAYLRLAVSSPKPGVFQPYSSLFLLSERNTPNLDRNNHFLLSLQLLNALHYASNKASFSTNGDYSTVVA